uniref:NmrA-like domain-containing protein n=1 Tax=Globisporangium ultimum (strain ATCC 200006 / CBS 805.95 / DAOM BR144) TaxID=431595 RepID=K3WCH4_GLOUD
MRVAVAGSGAFAKYFAEELPKAGHEVVILTRSHKAFFDGKPGVLEQRITDYSSVPQLVELLSDCDALVGTIYDLSKSFADIHLALIEACKQSPKCKRFIPSEYGANSEDYPEQPGSTYQYNLAVKDALKAQDELEWTVISVGWVMDYVVPSSNRYHSDIGPLFALDLPTKTMTIPGSGNEVFSITCARDVTKAVAELLNSPNKWRHYTYVQGEETTWLQVAEDMKTVGGMPDLEIGFEPADTLQKVVKRKESMMSMLVAEFKLYVPSGKLKFDQKKVQRDRAEFFPNVQFSTVKDALEAVKKDPTVIF